ncbi:type II 3-dehydroquinate dehydratase [Finegoldia magna]|uniref:3-dehydroquinate dehydratase n=4 Tax=Peptoniphilaceae TaxID=1570339 RepID=C2CI76_9FIRM|nr:MULTISPECIES: type II 3-dehydroquinate dehydratase [Bacillota]VSI21281.1 3-dehydroquinate dehydratase [Streptococcus pneumoniae]EEI82731.1 dehydroquinase class II [Anaerococcus tetradius ATCC 35098]KXA29455.1 3-dehydroquinate dehydratase, type II [Peptoniphilus harei]MCI4809344.1 type II 3-dehydroquinate dehydratase [Clostridioides difficile]MCU6007266.1 type II 3-dehydroquinate dehydratase [Clostridioides difficile]
MKKILVINGPNLNMLGIREPEIYGVKTYEDLCREIKEYANKINIEVDTFQSNHEGEIIDIIQKSYGRYYGIVINPGAYTHTSIAILDALKAVGIRTVEVHLTDIMDREDYRKKSFISEHAEMTIYGKGFEGYLQAIESLIKK